MVFRSPSAPPCWCSWDSGPTLPEPTFKKTKKVKENEQVLNSGFLTKRTHLTLPPPNEIGRQRTLKTKKLKENAPVPNSGFRTERTQPTLPPPNEIGLQRTDPSNDLAALLLPEQPRDLRGAPAAPPTLTTGKR